eukprot:5838979-Prymnesium_polylepis.1
MVTSPRSSTSILSRPIGPSDVLTTLATELAAVTARKAGSNRASAAAGLLLTPARSSRVQCRPCAQGAARGGQRHPGRPHRSACGRPGPSCARRS